MRIRCFTKHNEVHLLDTRLTRATGWRTNHFIYFSAYLKFAVIPTFPQLTLRISGESNTIKTFLLFKFFF